MPLVTFHIDWSFLHSSKFWWWCEGNPLICVACIPLWRQRCRQQLKWPPSDFFVFTSPISQTWKGEDVSLFHSLVSLFCNLSVCGFFLIIICLFPWNKTFSCLCFYQTWSTARRIQACCEIRFPVTLRISCHLFLTLYAVNKFLLAEDHKQSCNLCASIFHMSSQERYLSMTSFHPIHSPASSDLQSFYPFFLFLSHSFSLHPFESFLCAALVNVAQQWVMETP